jgi:hypothetical protein
MESLLKFCRMEMSWRASGLTTSDRENSTVRFAGKSTATKSHGSEEVAEMSMKRPK